MGRISNLRPRLAKPAASAGWSDPRRGSRHERGYGWAWEQTRARVLARDAGLCQPCMRRGHVTPNCNTVDHQVPKVRGGTDADANLQTICAGCHSRKTQAESRGETWDETSC